MRYNGNKFSVYESEEKTVLGLLDELGSQVNHNTEDLEKVKESDNKKVSHDEMNTIYKIDKNADFTGSWHGIKKPTASQEGLQATVDKIVEEDIPYINEQLETNTLLNELIEINLEKYKLPIESTYDNAFQKVLDKIGEHGVIKIPNNIVLNNEIDLSNKKSIVISGTNTMFGYGNNELPMNTITSNATNIFKLTNSSHILFTNISIVGNQNNIAIYGENSKNISFFNVNITNCNTAISFKSVGISKFQNLNVGDNISGIILHEYCGDATFNNCYINGHSCDDIQDNEKVGCGLYLGYGSNNCSIIGGKIEWNKTGICVQNSQGIIINAVQFDVNRRNHIRILDDNGENSTKTKSITISNNRFLGGGTNEINYSGKAHILAKGVTDINITSNNFKKGGDLAFDNNTGTNIGAINGIHLINCFNPIITNNDLIDCAVEKDINIWNDTVENCRAIIKNNNRNINTAIDRAYYIDETIPKLSIIGDWRSPFSFSGVGAYMWFNTTGSLRIKTDGKPTSENDGREVMLSS